MEAHEIIDEFRDFFENNCIDNITKANSFLEIEFSSLSQWDIDLADELLKNPEDTIKAAEIALKRMSIAEEKNLSVWFIGLPESQQRNVWEVRKDDVGRMLGLKGIINKASSIIHICKSAKFECPSCGNTINILQSDSTFREPNKCSCGRKGKMMLLDKEITDCIKLGLIDDLMDETNIDRSIAREKLSILSGNNLTSHEIDRKIKPGRKVILNGYFKYLPKPNSTEFNSIFQVNSIEFVQVSWDTVQINKEEEKQIKRLAKDDDIIDRLSESIADI